MKQKLFFTETQKCRQWWVWIIALLLNVPFLCVMYMCLTDMNGSIHLPSYMWIGIVALVLFALSILVIHVRLDTLVTRGGIYVRMMPFNISYIHYDGASIKSVDIGSYTVKEHMVCHQRKVFAMHGTSRIKIIMNDGNIVLIGTQKPEELRKAIAKVGLKIDII